MLNSRLFIVLAAAAFGGVIFLAAGRRSGEVEAERIAEATRQLTVLSDVYAVDRKYRSMMGPSSTRSMRLLDSDPPELLWVTGYEAVMVGPDGHSEREQALMCHSNLDINAEAHTRLFGDNVAFSPRLFTLSQGQLSIRFPVGFGIPILSNESLDLTTQVLNLHLEKPDLEVRHKVSLQFVRDQDVGGSMQALFPIAGYGLALLEGESPYFGELRPDDGTHGPGCLVGTNASDHEYADSLGRKFSGHWVVPPGREVNHTLVTHLMRVPYDTTIHYIAVHLHPFAESLELRDLTTGETVFKSRARNFEEHVGLAHVEHFESAEGIPVYAGRDYEMISVYDNTTAEDQDSMAVMYMYLRDRRFDAGKARRLARAG